MFISLTGPVVRQPLDVLVAALRAGGEPTRMRALALVGKGELSVGELALALGQSQPRVSRHMKLLTDLGLAAREPEGAWVFYRWPPPGSPGRALVEGLVGALDPTDPVLARDAERLEEIHAARANVAQSYFADVAADWDRVRSLHLPEADIETEILAAAGPGPFARVVDVGAGSGRMMALFAPRAQRVEGFDVNRHMLSVARTQLAGLAQDKCVLRYGDIYDPPFPAGEADLVILHQVLHYLPDPGRAVGQAVRLLGASGRVLLIDFARHELEFLRTEHAHRRLGFEDGEVKGWLEQAGARLLETRKLAPATGEAAKLTVKIWTGAL
jgi:ubiquinone/menaquinone biosynthesis C-methylase UbiE